MIALRIIRRNLVGVLAATWDRPLRLQPNRLFRCRRQTGHSRHDHVGLHTSPSTKKFAIRIPSWRLRNAPGGRSDAWLSPDFGVWCLMQPVCPRRDRARARQPICIRCRVGWPFLGAPKDVGFGISFCEGGITGLDPSTGMNMIMLIKVRGWTEMVSDWYAFWRQTFYLID